MMVWFSIDMLALLVLGATLAIQTPTAAAGEAPRLFLLMRLMRLEFYNC